MTVFAFTESIRYRLTVASRVAAAAVGGYALTSALALLMALLWPVWPGVEGSQVLSFAVYVPIVLWAFHARSVWRVWGWLMLWTLLASGLCWWLLRQGGAA